MNLQHAATNSKVPDSIHDLASVNSIKGSLQVKEDRRSCRTAGEAIQDICGQDGKGFHCASVRPEAKLSG